MYLNKAWDSVSSRRYICSAALWSVNSSRFRLGIYGPAYTALVHAAAAASLHPRYEQTRGAPSIQPPGPHDVYAGAGQGSRPRVSARPLFDLVRTLPIRALIFIACAVPRLCLGSAFIPVLYSFLHIVDVSMARKTWQEAVGQSRPLLRSTTARRRGAGPVPVVAWSIIKRGTLFWQWQSLGTQETRAHHGAQRKKEA